MRETTLKKSGMGQKHALRDGLLRLLCSPGDPLKEYPGRSNRLSWRQDYTVRLMNNDAIPADTRNVPPILVAARSTDGRLIQRRAELASIA